MNIWLLTFLGFMLPLAISAQGVLDDTLSFEATGVTPKLALEQLSKHTSVAFIYAPESLPSVRKLYFKAAGSPLGAILRQILAYTDLAFLPSGQAVVIRPRRMVLAESELYEVSGHVRNIQTGEIIPSASIVVPSLQLGIIANQHGYYSVLLPKGIYWLEVSSVGYNFERYKIAIEASTLLDLSLKEKVFHLDTLNIIDNAEEQRARRYLPQPDIGRLSLGVAQIKQVPNFFGESDPVKTLILYPGIQHPGEGNTNIFVRGGAGDQNLILLDETPIYNAAHLLGFFSTFNTDIIKEINLYKSGIPAQYGGRLSSLLEIHTREGNQHRPKLSGGIGNLSGRVTFETPFADSTGTFIISGRRTYLDLLFKTIPNTNLARNKLFFYDIYAKATLKAGKKGKLSLSLFQGKDEISFQRLFGTSWLNQSASLRWAQPLGKRIFSQSIAYFTRFTASSEVNLASSRFAYHLGYELQDMGIKQHFSARVGTVDIQTGGSAIWHRYLSGQIAPASNNSFIDPLRLEPQLALESALYASAKSSPWPHTEMKAGLRWSRFDNVGPGRLFVYRKNPVVSPSTSIDDVIDTLSFNRRRSYHHYQGFEPRLSMSYRPGMGHQLTISYDRTLQYLHQLTNTNTPSPINMWAPVTPYIPPQIGSQFALGWLYTSPRAGFSLSIEVYSKYLRNQLDFKPQASLLLNNHLETEVLIGRGWGSGAEFLIKKEEGRLRGWISYTLSDARRQIKGINQNRPYPTSFNRRHNLAVVISYLAKKRVLLSANWIYASGIAYTFPAGKYEIDGIVVPYYTSRNGFQLEPVHRLDLSATVYRTPTDGQKNESNLVFSIYNVYARKNTYAYIFRPSTKNSGQTETVKLYLFSLIPSFTYNFYF